MSGAPRGAALPETAIVIGFTLALLAGAAELALVGFAQLATDGGAFAAAHAAALGKDASSAVAAAFPEDRNATLDVRSNTPVTTDVPVDYNVGATTDRHGGASFLRPSREQATLVRSSVGGSWPLPAVSVAGAAIEADFLVSNSGFDITGTDYNAATAAQKDYFQDDGNAPPFFIGEKYFWHCAQATYGGDCANADLLAMGSAEYLDDDNWNASGSGVATNGVYAAALLHQNTFAKLAAQLPDPATVALGTPPAALDVKAASGNACLKTLYGWDIPVPPGYPLGTMPKGAYPLHPLANAFGC